MSVEFVAVSQIPTPWGTFKINAFEDSNDGRCHLALTIGQFPTTDTDQVTLLRLHSECLTGDALFSQRCDCGIQLQKAMEIIAQRGRGVILYLRQEGRGIGLANKIRAYSLQDKGADTVEANEHLGFEADSRHYDICQPMLHYLGVTKVELLTNNINKVKSLESLGIEVLVRTPHHYGNSELNKHYLSTKESKLGHQFK